MEREEDRRAFTGRHSRAVGSVKRCNVEREVARMIDVFVSDSPDGIFRPEEFRKHSYEAET